MSSFTDEQVQEAVKKANKLGAQGLQVHGVVPQRNATESDFVTLVVSIPSIKTASETEWYWK